MTIIVQASQVTEATTRDLITFYNSHNLAQPIVTVLSRQWLEKECRSILTEKARALGEIQRENPDMPRQQALAELALRNGEPLVINGVSKAKMADGSTVRVHRMSRNKSPDGLSDVSKAEALLEKDLKPEDEITEEEALAELQLMKAAKLARHKTGRDDGRPTISADAVKDSWTRPEVAKARSTRDRVNVTANGQTGNYKSVQAAFTALSLPNEKVVRFRLRLKKERRLAISWNNVNYLFEIATKPE